MARIPILQGPAQLQTGNQTIRTAQPVAVTNAAVGQGLKNVGSTLFDISEKAKRANDVTNLTNASMAMQTAQMEFSKWQLSPEGQDESKWLGKWEEMNNSLKSQFDQMKMTPDARAQLQERLTSWSTRGTIQVQASAFKQAGQRVRQSIDNAMEFGKQTGDFTPARQAVNDYGNSGLALPEEKQAYELAITGAERQKKAQDFQVQYRIAKENSDGVTMFQLAQNARNDNILTESEFTEASLLAQQVEERATFAQMAAVNPIEAKNKLNDKKLFQALTPSDKASLAAQADGILKEYQGREVNDFADHVFVTGKTDGFRFQWNTSPAERAKIIEDAKPADKLTDIQIARKKLEVEAMIERYDPQADTTGMGALFITKNILEVQKALPQFATELSSMWSDAKKGGTKGEFSMEIADFDLFLAKEYGSKFKALEDRNGNIISGKENEFRRLQQEVTEKKKAFRLQLGKGNADARKTGQNIMTAPVADDVTSFFDMLDRNPLLPDINAQPQALPGQ